MYYGLWLTWFEDSPTIFTSIGLTDYTLWTGVYGVIKATGSIIFFTFFIDRFGRKWPWIVSSLCCAVCQYFIAGYGYRTHPNKTGTHSASYVAGGKAATAAIMVRIFPNFHKPTLTLIRSSAQPGRLVPTAFLGSSAQKSSHHLYVRYPVHSLPCLFGFGLMS